MKHVRLLGGLALGMGALALALLTDVGRPRGHQASAQGVASASRAEIHALARLEPATGLLTLGARPGARVETVLVSAGDSVQAGQPLAVLEGLAAARAQLALAEAQKLQAQEVRTRKRKSLEVERKREDRVQKVRLQTLESIHTTLDSRAKQAIVAMPLLEKQADVTARDKVEFQVGLDRIKIDAARALLELEQARADQESLAAKRALEDGALAEGGADDALQTAQVDAARAVLDQATIKAPRAGRVLEVLARPGEVCSGPLMLLGDTTSMFAIAEVDQADLTRVVPGAAAEVDILGKRVTGSVRSVGKFVGRNILANLDPRMPLDLRVGKVTIALDDPEAAARLVNMQVDVILRPNASAP